MLKHNKYYVLIYKFEKGERKMKKSFIKKLSLSLVLTLGVGILSNTTLVHAGNKTQYIEKYEIYPISQDIQYTGGNVTIPNEVNVVLK